jgi:alpha-1,3-rhamnosyl/mannosyltransferase
MKILVNSLPLTGLLTGISRYVRQLYSEMEKLPGVKVFYFDGIKVTDRMPEQADSLSWTSSRKAFWRLPDLIVFAARCMHRLLFEANLRRICATGRFDIYHETTFFPAALRSVPQVLTIYDLSLINFASTHPRERVWFFKAFRKGRMPFASRIITISHFIKGEICSILKVPPDKIDVIHLAPAPSFYRRSPGRVESALRRLSLPGDFLLFVGSLEPRKNLPMLIAAMKRARTDLPLVLAGWEGWGDKGWLRELKVPRLKDRIFFAGHVTEEDLACLYSAATALVYPSLYEGFGLPVLEAMACGCPVICSNAASLPEVAGDAAVFFKSDRIEELVQEIDCIAMSDGIKSRIAASGKSRAENFNWNKAAIRTLELFKDTVASKPQSKTYKSKPVHGAVSDHAESKSVLMACTHHYESSIQVGSQHLARCFARDGWKVAYFSAPVTPLHFFKVNDYGVRLRFKKAMQVVNPHEDGSLISFVPFSMLAPDGKVFLREPVVSKGWYRTSLVSPWRAAAKAGFTSIDVLYIDNIFQAFWLDRIPYRKSVFRIMDYHERFPGWSGKAKWLACEIAAKADLVVYSAKDQKDYVDSLKPKRAIFLPNGVDFDHFQNPMRPFPGARHPAISMIPDPFVLYSGSIDLRLDLGLLRDSAKALPGIAFVIAGPAYQDVTKKAWSQNVHFIGPIPHDELPWLMSSAKAGIIPFVGNTLKGRLKGVSPLKLLEYMAAGLPVVSTRWQEIDDMKSPAFLCSDKKDFIGALSLVAKQEWNPLLSRQFALRFDWRRSFRILLEAIQE